MCPDLHGSDAAVGISMSIGQIIATLRRNPRAVLIALGDYGDRGTGAHTTLLMILTLKIMFPKQVVLLRGNHEVRVYRMCLVMYRGMFAVCWG